MYAEILQMPVFGKLNVDPSVNSAFMELVVWLVTDRIFWCMITGWHKLSLK